MGSLLAWQRADVSVQMTSPREPGIYESKWRMSTAAGNFFGDIIWVILTVEPSGTLAITQEMNKFNALGPTTGETTTVTPMGPEASNNGDLMSTPPAANPFASPSAAGASQPIQEDEEMD